MENNKQTKINIDDIANDLWASCDELRGNISSEQYMHIIIGIIFLKTISDKYNYAINALKDKYKDKFNDSIKNDSDLISEFFFIRFNCSRWSTLKLYFRVYNW